MDLGILFGLLGTWVLIVWALSASGSFKLFWDPASFILVVGGVCTTLFFCFPARHVRSLTRVAGKAFSSSPYSTERLIEDLVAYAEIARRDGILALEKVAEELEDQFMVRGLQMAVDGTDPELIEQIMNNELDHLVERHEVGKGMFEALGKYAPAFGMIGTLVGLVIMLQNMADPKLIGPGMALAMLTTLYGALIANAIALPMADRLGRRSAEEVLHKTIVVHGVMAIQRGDNPRVVERQLRTFLPASARPREWATRDAASEETPRVRMSQKEAA